MIRIAIAGLAALGLAACQTGAPSAMDNGAHSAALENQNAATLNANSSVQPGGAGPSPSGGTSNPGTSGTVTNHPGTWSGHQPPPETPR
jgi:hypothetical protein